MPVSRNTIGFFTSCTLVTVHLSMVMTWVVRSFHASVADMAELTVVFQCIIFSSVPVLAIGTNGLIREWIARRFGQFIANWRQGSEE